LKEEDMMYNNKLAIAVKSNGKVLREFKDTAFIPFGSEYSLLIKNLNTVRVQVRVELDGTDATEGTWLIIAPNSEMELTRFIKNGNLDKGNRFKFIERTAGVEQHRGVKMEDGLIRVEYQFEQPPPPPVFYAPREKWVKKEVWTKEFDVCDSGYRTYAGTPTFGSSGIMRGLTSGSLSSSAGAIGSAGIAQNAFVNQVSASSATFSANMASTTVTSTSGLLSAKSVAANPVNDAGITVPGSVSDQQFKIAVWFPVETTKHVMVIRLLGETETGQPVIKPVTVKAKPKCTTCGHVNKAKSKFCAECGTSLELV
jgi:hypothetical protein